jgi:hypothetical protein
VSFWKDAKNLQSLLLREGKNNQRCFASLNMTLLFTLAAFVPIENCA